METRFWSEELGVYKKIIIEWTLGKRRGNVWALVNTVRNLWDL